MLLQIPLFHSYMAELYSIVYIYHTFFIHSSFDGQSGCFHILTLVNDAAMNIGAPVSFRISVFIFFGYIPNSGCSPLSRFLCLMLFSKKGVPAQITCSAQHSS